MTLTQARSYIGRLTHSGDDTDRYTPTDRDLAILTLGNHFVREAKIAPTSSTVTITASTAAVSFTSLTGFRPDLMRRCRVTVSGSWTANATRKGVEKIDFEEILRMRGESDETGTPLYIGFSSTTAAEVYPKPTYTGTLTVWWSQPFVSFTPATLTPDSVTINIPDDYLYEWLQAVADFVQLDDLEARQKYLEAGFYADLVAKARSAGSLAGDYSTRDMLED